MVEAPKLPPVEKQWFENQEILVLVVILQHAGCVTLDESLDLRISSLFSYKRMKMHQALASTSS